MHARPSRGTRPSVPATPRNPVQQVESGLDRKTAVVADLIRERAPEKIRRVLVVGCGPGREAANLAEALDAEVIGIDLNAKFDPLAAARVELRRGDARSLDFPQGSFDLTYSYHVLEHVGDHRKALAEMHRVLTPKGSFCVGTPNRARVVGYIGSVAPTFDKVRWNLDDLKARARGRFRNEFGAHAGFTKEELAADLRQVFRTVEDVTSAYYLRLYARHRRLVAALDSSRLSRYLFPAVYFFGSK
jgi:SAM-dependent methyltransferase